MELFIKTDRYTIGREDVTTLQQVYERRAVEVHVTGYWSDVIQIYVNRKYPWWGERNGAPDHTWEFKVTHSSGGRDTKVVADDVEAEENFGHALIATAEFARALRAAEPELEAIYQAERQAAKEEAARERAEKEARIAADPAVGERIATATLRRMAATMELTARDQKLSVMPRGWREEDGSNVVDTLTVTDTRSGAVVYRWKAAVERLAAASARTTNIKERA